MLLPLLVMMSFQEADHWHIEILEEVVRRRNRPLGRPSRPGEVVHGREAIRSGDAVRKVDGKTRIAGPERVALLAVFHRIAPMLLDGMRSEAAGAIEPALLARAPEELQKRVAISCQRASSTIRTSSTAGLRRGESAEPRDPGPSIHRATPMPASCPANPT